MTDKRPLFLLSNDDGIYAEGMQFLISALRPIADIVVMAPDGPRSGFSMSFTTQTPLAVRLVEQADGFAAYCCSGTPVDCVKVGLNQYCPRRPDLVISGVNHGDNASVNSHYSGTLGAAAEGVLAGIPGIAFSLLTYSPHANFEPLRPYVQNICQRALKAQLPPLTLLNVNFPLLETFKGVRFGRMAQSRWIKEILPCESPHSHTAHYWLTGTCLELEPEAKDTDRYFLSQGYVTITPTTLDNTSYELLRAFSEPTSPFHFEE